MLADTDIDTVEIQVEIDLSEYEIETVNVIQIKHRIGLQRHFVTHQFKIKVKRVLKNVEIPIAVLQPGVVSHKAVDTDFLSIEGLGERQQER